MLFAKYRSARRTSLRLSLFVAAVVTLTAAVATAHRAPGSLTTIEWNDRAGATEIVHRLHSHDAELGVGELLGIDSLSALDLEDRARIALYVEERFEIRHAGEALPLSLVGAELFSDHLLVYQEYSGELSGTIEIRDDILRDVFPAQVNQVNIEHAGVVRTLMFANDDAWHSFEFRNSATD